MTARHWDIKKRFPRITAKALSVAAFAAALAAALAVAVLTLAAGWNASPSIYQLTWGDGQKIDVSVVEGREEGRAIYIVAGIHGDEKAGWMAAEQLKDIKLEAGTLYILSPANRCGAAQNERLTGEGRDLNRNFPGDPEGCDAERIAAAIYKDIEDKKPDLVLDLHEARPEKNGRDALGNSLICQSIEETGDMILELMAESAQGMVGSAPLTLYGSPPTGSINRVITERLGIPVITIETFREEELEQRIENHLEIAEFIMKYYGLQQ